MVVHVQISGSAIILLPSAVAHDGSHGPYDHKHALVSYPISLISRSSWDPSFAERF